jgi:hypothetical protein
MEPTAALPEEQWRRVVVVAAMVFALVGGMVAAAGRTTAAEPAPGVREVQAQTPVLDPACRQLIAFPKRGWVCVDRR